MPDYPSSGSPLAVRAARNPLNPEVETREIDLSQARSAADGTALTFDARGVSFFSAPVNADLGITEAGAIKITGDKTASETRAPNSFWVMPGTAMRNYPFEKLTIENPAQPGRKCYLHWSMSVDFASQVFTPAVEAATGRAEVVRYGDPNDSNILYVSAYPSMQGDPFNFAAIGFQENRIKKEMLNFMNSRAANQNYVGFRKVRDAVGINAEFTKQGATYLYRMTGAAAQLDLRTRLPAQAGDIAFMKFRFTLIDVLSAQSLLHVLSAEVYNRFGVYECNPIVNPDAHTVGAENNAVEATRFESPWMRSASTGSAQGDFTVAIDGNAQFTDRAPAVINATLMIDVDVLYD